MHVSHKRRKKRKRSRRPYKNRTKRRMPKKGIRGGNRQHETPHPAVPPTERYFHKKCYFHMQCDKGDVCDYTYMPIFPQGKRFGIGRGTCRSKRHEHDNGTSCSIM
jgi:hypothetical protein